MEITFLFILGDEDNDSAREELGKLTCDEDITIKEFRVVDGVRNHTPTPYMNIDSRVTIAGLEEIKDFVSSHLSRQLAAT